MKASASSTVEIKRLENGQPTVIVDGHDIGLWIAHQPVTIRRRPNGTDTVIVELAAPNLVIDPDLAIVTDQTLTSFDTTEHVIPDPS